VDLGGDVVVSINQPAYLPWLGYFDRIIKSDIHIVLDHVQFEKNSMVNRNKIRTPQGWAWMTVPVLTKGRFGDLSISTLKINDTVRWSKKHWRTLEMNYSRAPFFDEYAPFFMDVFHREWSYLSLLVNEINSYVLEVLDVGTRIVYSSDLGVTQKKTDLILELCKKVDAKTYISGPFGRDYLDRGKFEELNIQLQFHDYSHPAYRQAFSGFEPYMSVIDLLFNHGPDSLEILRS